MGHENPGHFFTRNNSNGLLKITTLLGIAFAVFLSIFSLDVFAEHHTGVQIMVEFLIHLLPVVVVLSVVILSWKNPLIGVIAFASLALAYFFTASNKLHWTAFLFIMGPLLMMSILYLFVWMQKRKGISIK